MRRLIAIVIFVARLAGRGARRESAERRGFCRAAEAAGGTITVDGIAARIEGDIVTESQLNELAGFQKLVDGKAGSRADLMRELTDQWIVNTEAQTARFAQPKAEDVTQAYDDLAKRFSSRGSIPKSVAARD